MTDMADVEVLIPAAGSVPEGLLALSNIGCPAMIPVAGRPLIHWTLSYLRDLGLRRFTIAVPKRGLFVEDFVDCAFGQECDVSFLTPSREAGVGGTVKELADHATGRAALVVLGDTHFQLSDANLLRGREPFVLVDTVEESYRWCIARIADDGTIEQLIDKQPDVPGSLNALIGVYYFPDRHQLVEAARLAIQAADRSGRRTEMSDILMHLGEESPVKAVRAADWLDCGNADRQAASHRALLQRRAFNELSVDPVFSTITKRSRHVAKFVDEIEYLRLLPPDLSVLFPRVIDSSTQWDAPFLTMEYYGYPSLADVFVFENVDAGIWERVFQHLRNIIADGFMAHSRPLSPGTVREMCLGKTRTRLGGSNWPADLKTLMKHEGELRVNGRRVRNVFQMWDDLEQAVEHLEDTAEGCIIHGDMCLSNVLYDLRSRVCKLIDPRGSFGRSGLYGDIRYDVAKLYHSVYGLYDFIANDLFHVSVVGSDVKLDLRTQPRHMQVRERFENVFFEAFDRREVLLYTGFLFASMPPLHYDHPRRQIAMYANALLLLEEALEA